MTPCRPSEGVQETHQPEKLSEKAFKCFLEMHPPVIAFVRIESVIQGDRRFQNLGVDRIILNMPSLGEGAHCPFLILSATKLFPSSHS